MQNSYKILINGNAKEIHELEKRELMQVIIQLILESRIRTIGNKKAVCESCGETIKYKDLVRASNGHAICCPCCGNCVIVSSQAVTHINFNGGYKKR